VTVYIVGWINYQASGSELVASSHMLVLQRPWLHIDGYFLMLSVSSVSIFCQFLW